MTYGSLSFVLAYALTGRGRPRRGHPYVSVAESVTVPPACRHDAVAMRRLAQAAYQPYVARIGRRPASMTADYTTIAGAENA